MRRLACVELGAFPLQILRQRHPEWADDPVVVVAEDRPQARLVLACERARALGILPGQRYAQALALSMMATESPQNSHAQPSRQPRFSVTGQLRAGVVAESEVRAEVERLVERLRRFSPDVEPSEEEPGVFWLSGVGLTTVFGSASAWGRALASDLLATGFSSRVVVGFTRFGTYAVAKAGEPGDRWSRVLRNEESAELPARGQQGVADDARSSERVKTIALNSLLRVFRDAATEARVARAIPLARLSFEPRLRDWLIKIGVSSLGEYWELPEAGLALRCGRDALRWHRLGTELQRGTLWEPLTPQAAVEAAAETLFFDEPETDVNRLLFCIKGALDHLLRRLAGRLEAMAALTVELGLDAGRTVSHRLQPAEATLDGAVLLRLLHLRLEACPPLERDGHGVWGGVKEVRLHGQGVAAQGRQLTLFFDRPRRDYHAAEQALAELRAELGDDSVQVALLLDGHLPEAQFRWQALERLAPPAPASECVPVLVRRIRRRPVPLELQSESEQACPWAWGGLSFEAQGDGPQDDHPRGSSCEPIVFQSHGSVNRLCGPYWVTGGWWAVAASARPVVAPPDQEQGGAALSLTELVTSAGVQREYAYAEVSNGACLWIYWDRRRRRWFLQGEVA